MSCPICNQRKPKRACPALGQHICAVCCGTKRLVEINCPPDCGYLSASRSHPPAIVQRQLELDRAMMLPLVQGLSERQARVFLMLGAAVSRHQGDAFQRVVDDDIAQASAALAFTLETAGRGIVFEQQPTSLAASRLMAEMKTLVDEVVKNAGSALERDAAIALRRIEQGAKAMAAYTSRMGGAAAQSELQQLFARVLAPPPGGGPQEEAAAPASSLIIP
jgi:hypothetical protein